MLIALASVKGSPGVTTFALALTAQWPREMRPVLVECDPSGGDIAARFVLPLSPGLISLAAASRRTNDADLIWQHAQSLPGDLTVVPGPLTPDQARNALQTLGGGTASPTFIGVAARRPDLLLIADCGRLDGDTAAKSVLAAADRLLLLVRPTREELAHLAARLDEINRLTPRVELILAGDGYSRAEVAAELGVLVLTTVPHDPATAALLAGRPRFAIVPRRRLARAATDVAGAIASALAHVSSAQSAGTADENALGSEWTAENQRELSAPNGRAR